MLIFDNGGRTFDRFTVWFPDEGYGLFIGPTGNVPNGVCMSFDMPPGPWSGDEIGFDDLPEPVRRAVNAEVNWQRIERA